MNVLDIINTAIAEHRTRFAFELLPPLKGDGMGGVFAAIDRLIGFDPAYINVTFHREGIKQSVRPDGGIDWHVVRRRPGTVGISAAIQKKYGVEVVPHLICGGQSKYDIEDSLIDMDFLGLHNVLALRGDKRQNEPRFVPYAQGHAHAADLVRQIQAMNRGEFIDGEVEECHHSKFSVGVAGYPEKHFEAANAQSDLQYLKEKVDAGADYIVTQMFFDNSKYFDFVERCRKAGITVPIIPGIKPVVFKNQLNVLPKVFRTDIPEAFASELRKCENDEEVKAVGVEWCKAQCKDLLAHGVPGLHFYTFMASDSVYKVAKEIY